MHPLTKTKLQHRFTLLGLTLLTVTAFAGAQSTESPQGEAAAPAPRASTRRVATTDTEAVVAEDLPKEKDATASNPDAAKTASATDTIEKAPLTPAGLPTGADKSGVTTKTVSIPKGSGSIEGMGNAGLGGGAIG